MKRHNGPFYWLTRDVAPVLVALHPRPGPDFRYTNFSGGRNLHFTYTYFSGGRGLHFTYTNFSGGQGLDVTYTNFSGGRGLDSIYTFSDKNMGGDMTQKKKRFSNCENGFEGLHFFGWPGFGFHLHIFQH